MSGKIWLPWAFALIHDLISSLDLLLTTTSREIGPKHKLVLIALLGTSIVSVLN